MADTPSPPPRPRMGLHVLARHSAGRHGGRHLAHEVAEARAPKLLHASQRLAEGAALARTAHLAPPAAPGGWAPADVPTGVDPWPGAAGYDPWATSAAAAAAPADATLSRSPASPAL